MHRAPWWTGRSGSTSVRTLILSPDTIFAEALSMCLTSDDGIEVVGLALDQRTAADAVSALEPAVMVCDQRAVGPDPCPRPVADRSHRDPLRTVRVATMAPPTPPQSGAAD